MVAATLIACSARAVPQTTACEPFSRLDLTPGRGGVTRLVADLDCDGLRDSSRISRVAEGEDVGLPQLVVVLDGSRMQFTLVTDGLPRIVHAGDLDGDGVMDLLLANADESVSIWPTVVLVTADSIRVPHGLIAMGVYQYDPVLEPDCDYRDLLPELERGSDGKLLISWIRTRTTIHGPATNCHAPPRAHWEVTDGQLRLREASD